MQIKDLLDFGPFRADLRRRILVRDGQPVSLPAKAFDVLVVLLRNAGATVSKDDLLRAVWPDTFVEEGNLTQTVFLLRKALGDSDSQPLIVTVPRQGYRFVGNVTSGEDQQLQPQGEETEAAPVPRKLSGRLPMAFAILAAGMLGGVFVTVALRPSSPPGSSLTEPIRFEVPWEGVNAGPVLSPDGKRIATINGFRGASGPDGIWIREMNGVSPFLLAGTADASFPFWSPDSCCLGFFSNGKLKTVNLLAGTLKVVADAPKGRGGTWNQLGTIVFAPDPDGPLHSVPSAGGMSRAITSVDVSRNQNSHRWPVFLPDGRRFLFLAHSALKENLWVYLGELGKPAVKQILRSDSNVVYVPGSVDAGILLYLNNRTLLAQGLDLRRAEVLAEPRAIAKSIEYDSPLKLGYFSASANGILAYRTKQEAQTKARWFGRQGAELGELPGADGLNDLHLSRDGAMAAAERTDPETGTGDIWTFDLNRGGANRVTRNPAWESFPVLSPNNKEVVFASDRTPRNAYIKAVEGASLERPLAPVGAPDRQRNPYDWSSDGKFILYAVFDKNNEDLWVFQTDTRREYPLVQSPFNESQGQFSSDVKWIAYTSDETAKPEVYVREFLPPDKLGEQRTKVSVDGGTEPRWRQDGRELFYIGQDGALMVASIQPGAPLRAGKPMVVFAGKLRFGFGWHSKFSYAATADGQKFLLVSEVAPAVVSPITVVLNGLHRPK